MKTHREKIELEKEKLDEAITNAVKEFEKVTGFEVEEIDIDRDEQRRAKSVGTNINFLDLC